MTNNTAMTDTMTDDFNEPDDPLDALLNPTDEHAEPDLYPTCTVGSAGSRRHCSGPVLSPG
ncbi:hypothetical protein [Micromonospora sp. WMMD737]|uniref:hypothetical protein n=1 Tax=Micromonospora sp. WMMD737 TaxID=3404113 RepID=UPI003B930BD7